MASFDELRKKRLQQGQEAKQRVLSRASGGSTTTTAPAAASKFDAIRKRPSDTIAANQAKEKATQDFNNYHSKIDTTNLTVQPRPPVVRPGATPAQQQLGIAQAQPQPFQTQPVSSDLLRSNPSVVAATPVSHNPINALYQQIRGNPNGPTVELPSTGSKALDRAAHFVGETAGQILQNPVGGTEQTIAQGLEYGAARALPKVAPIVTRTAANAATGAIENAAAGAGIGQTSGRDIATNAAVGAGFGGAGTLAAAGLRAAGRKVADVAEDLVRQSLGNQRALSTAGESSLRADAGKRILSDIDEQLSSLSSGNAANKNEQYKSLLNERNDAISYIKQHEPEFEATTPRLRASNEVQPVKEYASVPQTAEPEVETPSKFAKVRTRAKAKPAEPGVRGFVNSVNDSENIADEVKTGLNASPNSTYKPITNEGTLKKANRAIAKDADRVESELLSKRKYDATDVAKGIRTIQELQNAGEYKRAVTIAENLSRHLTEAGQTIQAASILNRLSPEGALEMVTRKVNKINDSLLKGQEPVKVTPEQASNITQAATTLQAAGVSQERAGTVLELMTKARNGEALTGEEKQTVADFVKDAKQYIKKEDTNAPAAERLPKEFANQRTRQKVVSFLDKQEAAARERMAARRNRFNSTPFDEWADMAIIAASKMAKGAIRFGDFSSSMIRDFGESVRPQLRKLYSRGGELLRDRSKQVSSTAVSEAERVAESYLRANEARLQPEDIDLVRNLAEKVSTLSGKQAQTASQDLHAILNSFEKAGVGRKLSATQYIAMLLNPLTQIRNIVGNELMYRLERLGRIIGTPMDIVASKVSGGPRRVTFKSGPRIWDDYFTPASDYWSNLGTGAKAGWHGVNPEGLASKYEIQGQAFKSRYNPLTYLEKTLGATMKGFDHAAYNRSVNQQMREMAYLDALNKGVKGADAQREHIANYMANIDGATHEIVSKYGKYVTLQDESLPAKGIAGIRSGLNTITGNRNFGVGSFILPFAKTPGNLLDRTLDYSPVGILKGMANTWKIIRDPKTDLTRADVIANVSRALLGSGIGALGYYLADLGVLQGKSSDDAEVRKLMAQGGVKDFQINGTALRRVLSATIAGDDVKEAAKMQPGDTLWGYQWAAPTSAPLAIGNTIYQGTKNTKGTLATAGKSAMTGLETLLDSSVLSGLQEAFATTPGDGSPWAGFVMNIAKQIPSMYLPSSLRQANTIKDERVKETYSPDALQSYLNPTYQNVPGNNLPQRVDTLGHPQTKANSYFDVFLSPAARTKYTPTPEAKFLIDLLNETGDQSIAPRAVSKYVQGKDANNATVKKDLSTEQYVELQTLVGKKTAELINQINPNLPTEDKVQAVLKALTAAGKYGRSELKKELGLT